MKKVFIVTAFFGTFLFLAYAVAQQGAPKSEQRPSARRLDDTGSRAVVVAS